MKKKSFIISFIVLLFDQLIKIIINNSFYYGKLAPIIPNFFYITKVYNDGAAWSVFRGKQIFLIIIAILALIVLIKYEDSFANKKRTMIGFGLIYGGLFGNLIDRLFLNHVVDYFKVILGTYEFPIFNLADVTIVVGFVLLLFAIYKGEDKNGNKSSGKWYKNR